MMPGSEETIWKFATDFYEQPGVAPACLTLQDEADLDVIHLILLLYADIMLGQPLSMKELPVLRHEMTNWREVTVLPLRAIRRRLKADEPGFPREKEALRSEIKRAELLAERMQLAIGEAWLRRRPARTGMPIEEAVSALLRLYGGDSVVESNRCRLALLRIAKVISRAA